MNHIKTILLILLGLIQMPAWACESSQIDCFIETHRARIGWSDEQWARFFAQRKINQRAIDLINKPSTSRPWYVFQRNHLSKQTLDGGVQFATTYHKALTDAQKRYGVPLEIIVAIIGIETHYGRNQGTFNTADALFTLGFMNHHRDAFFRDELASLLELSNQLNREPQSFYGSYAGAIGIAQFMPSSWLKWAVDGDQNGIIDLWSSPTDAIASVAYYLQQHGYRPGQLWRIAIQIPDGLSIDKMAREDTALKYTVRHFRQMGIFVPPNIADDERAFIYRLEISPDKFQYYLGFSGFYAIWQYNHSRLYVESVLHVAEYIRQNATDSLQF